MKAREPKLKIGQLDTEEIDVCQWILDRCANYAEAADFFQVTETSVKRWMNGTSEPSGPAKTAVILYNKLIG